MRRGNLWHDEVARTGPEVIVQEMSGCVPKGCDVTESLLEIVIALVFSPILQTSSELLILFLLNSLEEHFLFVILRP